MITVICPNPAVDRTIILDRLVPGTVGRSLRTHIVAGGKGLNVARALRAMGCSVQVVAFAGGWAGEYLVRECRREGMAVRWVESPEESRTCSILVDLDARQNTVLNEPGPPISAAALAAFRSAAEAALDRTDMLVLSGSLPPGVPASLYADLIRSARTRGVPAFLDASGEVLRLGLAARPWGIKPTVEELAAVLGPDGPGLGDLLPPGGIGALALDGAGPRDLVPVCRRLVDAGIEQVIITLGGQGALHGDTGGVRHAAALPVTVVSPTGAGDAFVAGFVAGWSQGPEAALRLATAAAALEVTQEAPVLPAGADLALWAAQVRVQKVG